MSESRCTALPCVLLCLIGVAPLMAAEAAPGGGWGAWHLEGPAAGSEGIDVRRVLSDWPLVAPADPVVVAVLDSGFDVDHPAFDGVWWRNGEEVGGTDGVDDDGNGFVDDRHGWSFLASSAGTDLGPARLEVTRELVRLEAEIEAGDLLASDPYYQRVKQAYAQEQRTWGQRFQQVYMANAIVSQAAEDLVELGVEPVTSQAVTAFEPTSPRGRTAKQAFLQAGGHEVQAMYRQCEVAVDYWYDRDFDESVILGDDPDNPAPTGYGAPNLSVGHLDAHGTMVAGLVGARPVAGSEMRGVCPWVEIIALRVVPEGDERDKDVANGIRYAVAHGAQVICMSFGKGYSPDKVWVDAAMREAEEAGVLVVHGAGNEGADIDSEPNFPNPTWVAADGSEGRFENWLTVGASESGRDHLVASYSNYGKREVDILAPGSRVTGPTAGGGYETSDGTSLSGPLVAGAAALLWSQYPEASVQQVKLALMAGARRYPELAVIRPGTRGQQTSLAELCVSGGLLDLPGALRALDETAGDGARWPAEE